MVENCTLSSDSPAIKFGTGSLADMKNVTFRNINIRNSRNAGIRIVNLDGGTFTNLLFEQITFESDVSVWFLCGKGGSTGGQCVAARDVGGPEGAIHGVTFRDITIENGGGWNTSKINDMDWVSFRDIDFAGANSTGNFC